MTAFDKLVELFRTFPGIGPRQARRFAFYLIRTRQSFNKELSAAIDAVKREIRECSSCHRFFSGVDPECPICTSPNRTKSLLMIVAHDTDLESIEKSKTYEGTYFVLGDLMSLVDKETHVRERELLDSIKKRAPDLSEIIIALSVTAEGDYTTEHLQKLLSPLVSPKTIISTLGRGVSTGSELEYADGDTIKNALLGRRKL